VSLTGYDGELWFVMELVTSSRIGVLWAPDSGGPPQGPDSWWSLSVWFATSLLHKTKDERKDGSDTV